MSMNFVADPFAPSRRRTRVVHVGDVALGGDEPVRIQSMTTTDTLDTLGTADQAEHLAATGCEIVRITAPSKKEAENLRAIRAELTRRGVHVPLVADIHYTPNAAMVAAEHVEKIRVNPGNYVDKKKFEVREYTDAQYREEIERAAERFRPLVRRCKELGRAMRIGTNHGSLADRILNRYGDTPAGMVESALEFLEVCEDEGYRNLVFSMKSSNAQVAIQAYRLLAARLEARAPGEPGYPFHLGVTEAGDGEDGRIKSAIGIGSLLEDGIGDTIRVSLTEDPTKEVPVARAIAARCQARVSSATPLHEAPEAPFCDDPFAHRQRVTRTSGNGILAFGGTNPVRVELSLGALPRDAADLATRLSTALATLPELTLEGVWFNGYEQGDPKRVPVVKAALRDANIHVPLGIRAETSVANQFVGIADRIASQIGHLVEDLEMRETASAASAAGTPLEWELRTRSDVVRLTDRALAISAESDLRDFAMSIDSRHPVHAVRALAARLRAKGAHETPIVLRHHLNPAESQDAQLLGAAIDIGAPLCDGIGDAVAISTDADQAGRALDIAFRTLQGARRRTTRTEFISCPSCGRTLFDLEETTARIKAKTGHLVGVKIAVMGCIVNGPGEMADADFGYVGSGPGLVNLYVGQECIERHVDSDVADERLVALIRSHGRWVDPS